MEQLHELALFAGAGGGILGGHLLGWKTVCAVELEDYPRRVLLARQKDGILPRFPIWDDVTTFNGQPWRERVDVVSGGFPCQRFSSATHGRQTAPDLTKEFARVVGEIRPSFVFAENVSADAVGGLARELYPLGYITSGVKISAQDVGADHLRRRYWTLAYTNSHCELCLPIHEKASVVQEFCVDVWKSGPDELRVANGMADRVVRIKAIGNGQVPAVAALAWNILSEGLV